MPMSSLWCADGLTAPPHERDRSFVYEAPSHEAQSVSNGWNWLLPEASTPDTLLCREGQWLGFRAECLW